MRLSAVTRSFRPTDFEEVWAVHLAAVLAAGFSREIAETDFDHDILGAYQGGEFLVATLENRIVGMGGLKRVSENVCEITRMRVHPEFQKQGVGAQILGALESRGRKLNFSHAQLDTANHSVRGFYESHGYRFVNQQAELGFEILYFAKDL